MSILLLGLVVPAMAFIASAGASAPLDTLQVTIQTTESLPFQYTLTAYNTSGYQVASFGGNYPEAAFGLPDGTYLVTASAYSQQTYCKLCPLAVKNTNGTTVIPVAYSPAEYGYAVVKLTGPTQITITTRNSTQGPLTNIPVHVQFVNGTAAVGAYVSGYVVGGNYMNSQQWVTYGQTGSDGNFTLVMPSAPIQVSAYMSIPIQLPQNISTVPVEVGGQKVNVTVYWQPNYVYLSGMALVLPPQMSAEITLKVQQSSSYPVPVYSNGGGVPSGAVTTVTETMSAMTASASPQAGRIAPFNPTNSQLSSPSQATSEASPSLGNTEYLIAAVGAAALVVGAFALLVSRRNRVESARP
jgi:hypothetical protein